MSGPDDFQQKSRKAFKTPNSARNPIPTIQQYRDAKQKQKEALQSEGVEFDEQKPSQLQSAIQAGREYWAGGTDKHSQNEAAGSSSGQGQSSQSSPTHKPSQPPESSASVHDPNRPQGEDESTHMEDTTQEVPMDQKQKRKQMKHRNPDLVQREVTDPVTHLPVVIHDFSSQDVARFLPSDHDQDAENDGNDQGDSPTRSTIKTLRDQGRAESNLDEARSFQQGGLDSIKERFPPPSFELAREQLGSLHRKNFQIICLILASGGLLLLLPSFTSHTGFSPSGQSLLGRVMYTTPFLLLVLGMGLAIWVTQTRSQNQVQSIWEDAVWAAQHTRSKEDLSNAGRESTLWFSKIIGSIWPLVNPDLFTSVADTLEDVMQASLPRFVRMVSVDDIGQGSEPLRILGVNWLPRGAAAQSVTSDGKLGRSPTDKAMSNDENSDNTDKSSPAADAQHDTTKDEARNTDDGGLSEGMEGEEGDFVNLEIAFAYRTSQFQKKFSERAKNAHLYLAFYLPGNIKLPVWVEVKGIVGICRVRLQLTPDPPFVALCTLTFLGQPKVDMTCVPLVKRGFNIMDLPLISNFVQGSIDAALSEYVAPKSISLDLHAMLAGDDFKRDTVVRGILVIRIYRCFDFKAGDAGIPLIRPEGSSDSYVSVGWAKFGKPLWSTRVIADDMEPYWNEEAFIPVGPEELDAGESLRVQLWDSDKFSADDDQGRIELGLKDLMTNENSDGKMWHRTDPFKALQADKDMPGRCEWSVGYFSKTRLLEAQIRQQKKDRDITSIDDLKQSVFRKAERKLRETAEEETSELEQQKQTDWEATETQMISDSLPPEDYPSGILSIHVHQIVGLNLQQISKSGRDVPEGENNDPNDDESQLADSYCTIILNHRKIFKTRTKPKNAAPFFNAATERFIRDWRHTDLTLSVRDARVHEDDALIGFVHFNLGEHFRRQRTSRSNDFYPLSGGIGYGRVRVSLCFRSVQLQAPPRSLGWDLGTIELTSGIDAAEDLPENLQHLHLKVRTDLSSGRMHAKRHGHGKNDSAQSDSSSSHWAPRGGKPLLLAVQRRYASCLIIEFRNNAALRRDKVPACAVLWLSQVQDDTDMELDLPVWRADKGLVQRLEKNCLPESMCGEKMGSLRVRLRFWHGMGQGHAETLGKRNLDVQNIVEVLQSAHDMGMVGPLVGSRHWEGSQSEQRDQLGAHTAAPDDASQTGAGDEDGDNSSSEDDGYKDSATADEAKVRKGAEKTQPQKVQAAPLEIDSATMHPAAFGSGKQGRFSDGEGDNAGTPRGSMGTEAGPSRTQSTRSSKRGSGLFSSASEYLDNKAQLHRQHRGMMQWKAPRTLAWMKHKADKTADRVSASFEHSGREPDIETEV